MFPLRQTAKPDRAASRLGFETLENRVALSATQPQAIDALVDPAPTEQPQTPPSEAPLISPSLLPLLSDVARRGDWHGGAPPGYQEAPPLHTGTQRPDPELPAPQFLSVLVVTNFSSLIDAAQGGDGGLLDNADRPLAATAAPQSGQEPRPLVEFMAPALAGSIETPESSHATPQPVELSLTSALSDDGSLTDDLQRRRRSATAREEPSVFDQAFATLDDSDDRQVQLNFAEGNGVAVSLDAFSSEQRVLDTALASLTEVGSNAEERPARADASTQTDDATRSNSLASVEAQDALASHRTAGMVLLAPDGDPNLISTADAAPLLHEAYALLTPNDAAAALPIGMTHTLEVGAGAFTAPAPAQATLTPVVETTARGAVKSSDAESSSS